MVGIVPQLRKEHFKALVLERDLACQHGVELIVHKVTFLKGLTVQVQEGGGRGQGLVPGIGPYLMVQVQGLPDAFGRIVGHQLFGGDGML